MIHKTQHRKPKIEQHIGQRMKYTYRSTYEVHLAVSVSGDRSTYEVHLAVSVS